MIKFSNVRKTYKNSGNNAKEALKGVSFLIDDGEFVFVIGKSGSGKSTILKCMNCEERPTEGTITIDGFPISDMSRALVPVLRRQIGMIFQDFRLIETKTVAENISFAGEMMGLSRKSLHQKVQLVLNIVGLKDKADAYPQQLSGGEQQRIAIARAMLNNPKIIIADEPTGNLDPEMSENIMALLLDINRSGTTVIVCTHDANMVDRMKKRVIEIEDGIVVRDQEDSAYAEEEEEKPIPEMALNVEFGEDADYHGGYDEDTYNVEKPPVGDFYFGDTPSAPAAQAVTSLPVSIPPVPVTPAPVPAPVAPIPVSETSIVDDGEEEIEEIAFGDMTDISDLPVENEIEEAPVEFPENPVREPAVLPEVPVQPVLPELKEEIPVPVEAPVAQQKEEVAETPAEEIVDESADAFVEQLFGKTEAVNEATVAEEEEEIIEEVPVSEFYFGEVPAEVTFEEGAPEEEPVKEEPVKEEPVAEAPVEDDSWLKEVRMDDIDLDIQEDDDE